MEVMIAQGTIAQGPRQGARGDTGSPRGRPRTRGQLGRAGSGLARPGRVEGAAGGGGWPGPAGEGPLCTWSSWCIEAPPAWGAVLTSLGLSLFFSGGRAPFGVGPCGPSRALLSDFRSWASFPDSPQTPSQPPRALLAPARPLPPPPPRLHPLAHAPFSRQPSQISPGPLGLRASPRRLCLLSRVTRERVCVYPSVSVLTQACPEWGPALLFGCIGWELGASMSSARPGSSLPPWAGGVQRALPSAIHQASCTAHWASGRSSPRG